MLCIPTGSFLVTLDVTSFYTNIPHDEGIEAVIKAQSEDLRKLKIDPFTLSTLTSLLVELSHFEFEIKRFREVSGRAMGRKIARNYASISMALLELNFLSSQSIKQSYFKLSSMISSPSRHTPMQNYLILSVTLTNSTPP